MCGSGSGRLEFNGQFRPAVQRTVLHLLKVLVQPGVTHDAPTLKAGNDGADPYFLIGEKLRSSRFIHGDHPSTLVRHPKANARVHDDPKATNPVADSVIGRRDL